MLLGCSKQILLLSKGYMQILLLDLYLPCTIILCSVIQERATPLPAGISSGHYQQCDIDPIFIFGLGPVKALNNGAAIAGVLPGFGHRPGSYFGN